VIGVTRSGRALSLAAATLLALSRLAFAQTIHGTVRDSTSQQPVPGAVITLLDSSGAVLARGISGGAGSFAIALRTSVRKLRLQRIGFRPRELDVREVSAAAGPVDIALLPLPTFLEPVRSTASACPKRSDQGPAITLLEQARSGLLSTVVGSSDTAATLVRLAYRKRMDANSDRVERMTVRRDSSVSSGISFEAGRPARDFANRGFVVGDSDSRMYFGPDPAVILDDDFIAAYCFRVMPPDRKRPTQVGLGFSPSDRKRDRIDIDGALWIDTVARAIRDVEFRYLGFNHTVDALEPGGLVSFREMPTGIGLVDRWHLRLIGADVDTIFDIRSNPTLRQTLFAQESGGELARASWPDGHSWSGALGTLRVHALTHAGTAAPDIRLLLPGTPYDGITDAAGNLELPMLVPGPYTAVVIEPHLTALGIVLETPIKFVAARDSIVEKILDVPTIEDYARDRCEQARGPQPQVRDPRYIVGRVTTDDDLPLEGVRLNLQAEMAPNDWRQLKEFYVTGGNGLFEFCPKVLSTRSRVRVTAAGRGLLGTFALAELTERVTVVPLRVERQR
jgi:hypothetical protein